MPKKNAELEAAKPKSELSMSERFTTSVLASWNSVARGLAITDKEKGIIANYFIHIDKMLANSKQGYKWNQVRMNELALTLAHTAKLGLDMSLDNMLSFIPFKVGDTGTINLIPVIGKKGYEYIAKTFALNPPENVIVELVHKNDTFSIVKRDATHPCDDYSFEITNPFDRGEVVGAFGYLVFSDSRMNLLMVKSKTDLLKYRPKYFDQNFWSGENELKMLEKTMAKQILKKVTIDPSKFNQYKDSFDRMEASEIEVADYTAREEIADNMGTGEVIDVDFAVVEETPVIATDDNGEVTNMFGEKM